MNCPRAGSRRARFVHSPAAIAVSNHDVFWLRTEHHSVAALGAAYFLSKD
jgi:hypothetical protein